MSKPNLEQQRGLLEPESFDLDDLETQDPLPSSNGYSHHPNGHARRPSSGGRKVLVGGRSRRKWVIALVVVLVVMAVGVALNRGEGIKLPGSLKMHKGDEGSGETKKKPEAPVAAPEAKVKEPDPPKKPETPHSPPPPPPPAEPAATGEAKPAKEKWEKPKDFKIIGLIFFGRPVTVAILDCYLKKNLVSNGGWLDEVHFVINTGRKEDIEWVDGLLKTEKRYKRVDIKEKGYNAAWATLEKEPMYIKIDDDIVWFNDEAIPDIVYSKLAHPETLDVVANLINSPETGWLHYRLGAIRAYLPERMPPKNPSPESLGPNAWRASALPIWQGTFEQMNFPVKGANMGKPDDGGVFEPGVEGGPPFKGHRWLPLPDGEKNLWRTPMSESKYDPDGPDWASWSLGAQNHYSFLENLENDNLTVYHYGAGLDEDREGIWNMAYARMNINFMAIWGKDVLDNLPFDSPDDELQLSVTVNKKLRRPLLVNTHALAAHFSFRSQHEMFDTDLLNRYRAYANEMVCKDGAKIPMPVR